MKQFLPVLGLFFLAHQSLKAQNTAVFPESWSGDWKGTLEIFNGKGKVQSVEMTVEIHKIDTSTQGRYTFGLVYGSKEQDWRPYELARSARSRVVESR
jgi:hypothetical protein